ncbi:MAG: dethiobiotin synthase [Gammaproteobacteria bacterium]
MFVTGTDTGVGKTYVGAAVIRGLRARGVRVLARKPVESGCDVHGGQLMPADAAILHTAAGRIGNLMDVCPFRFRHALSPARAAHLESRHLIIAELEQACVKGVSDDSFAWIEGAGGFYSPLAADGLNADLAARLRLPVLLVAADRLGCLNHVLLTTEAIRARGLSLLAVVLNQIGRAATPAMNNADDLKQRLTVPLFKFGHCSNGANLCTRIMQLID